MMRHPRLQATLPAFRKIRVHCYVLLDISDRSISQTDGCRMIWCQELEGYTSLSCNSSSSLLLKSGPLSYLITLTFLNISRFSKATTLSAFSFPARVATMLVLSSVQTRKACFRFFPSSFSLNSETSKGTSKVYLKFWGLSWRTYSP